MRDTPLRASYWVVEGVLLAGEYPGSSTKEEAAAKLGRLLDAGITRFVDLTQGNELRPYAPHIAELAGVRDIAVSCDRFAIRDYDVPSEQNMVRILAAINQAILDEAPVYLHCWGGIGRTGTVVGCWLVQEQGLTGDQALARIAELRRHSADRNAPSPETEAQRDFIRRWAGRSDDPPTP